MKTLRKIVITKKDWLFTLFPIVFWAVLVVGVIPTFSLLNCQIVQCHPEDVFFIDRLTVHLGSRKADLISHWVQNLSGAFVIVFFLVFHFLKKNFRFFWKDLLLLVQATAWNGAINSLVRFIIARPRPFVVRDPETYGADPSSYTSFYSGHTSFVALAMMTFFLLCRHYGFSKKIQRIVGTLGVVLVLLTGGLRVMAGVHFPTDVFVGALMGGLISFGVFRMHLLRS